MNAFSREAAVRKGSAGSFAQPGAPQAGASAKASLVPRPSGNTGLALSPRCPPLHKWEFAVSGTWGLEGSVCKHGAICLPAPSVVGCPDIDLSPNRAGYLQDTGITNAFVLLRLFIMQKSHRRLCTTHEINLPHWNSTAKRGQERAKKTQTWSPASRQLPVPQKQDLNSRQGPSLHSFKQKAPNAAITYPLVC